MRITIFGARWHRPHLGTQALDAGHEVTAVVRDPTRLPHRFSAHRRAGRTCWIRTTSPDAVTGPTPASALGPHPGHRDGLPGASAASAAMEKTGVRGWWRSARAARTRRRDGAFTGTWSARCCRGAAGELRDLRRMGRTSGQPAGLDDHAPAAADRQRRPGVPDGVDVTCAGDVVSRPISPRDPHNSANGDDRPLSSGRY